MKRLNRSGSLWKRLMIVAVWLLPSVLCDSFSTSFAQSNDFGMWYELGAEKKLSRKWNIGAEVEFRTRNNVRTADRVSAGLSAEFKIFKWLKASAGYVFLYNNNKEELSMKSDNLRANKWTPGFWGVRHRTHVSLTGSFDWNRLSISLRERWQFTYRPEAKEKKYDIDEDAWEDLKSKSKHLLRSRLQLSYDIPHWKFDPFANVELFNGWNLQKIRVQAGVEYKYKKHHAFALTYRFQKVNESNDDEEVNSHIIGLSYKFKF